ncbi:DNA repair protein xrcc1 [Anaeramoeba ignava]|uniref:DNA repair protein xrcc1 n=1 Tax=Anaeramoeba ignava TaxID=1746090 RepID=A0A9Q0RD57_ANAIG|nr:DNA repair protein xrcc1 [Anaeramoeba ignava]
MFLKLKKLKKIIIMITDDEKSDNKYDLNDPFINDSDDDNQNVSNSTSDSEYVPSNSESEKEVKQEKKQRIDINSISSNFQIEEFLPNFFNQLKFLIDEKFLSNSKKRKSIIRLIIAYGGIVQNFKDSSINFIVVNQNFAKSFTEKSNAKFISLKWIELCDEKQERLDPKPYIIK